VALTPSERKAFAGLTVFVALTRWLTRSRTLWDWDEALFVFAMRSFDVRQHHPHPPGFPLFIGTAKLFRLVIGDDFHALQAVNLLAAAAVFPAMFFLCRMLRASVPTSFAGGLFLAFFPNVWFYGGTAFSDVPALVLVVLAVALILRGCTDAPSLLLGAVVLGIAAGYRPQNLAVGLAPMLVAAWCQRRRLGVILGAVILVAALVASSYAAAAMFSGGWSAYGDTLREHQAYIDRVDSFHSPIRPPLMHLFDDFFVRPYRAPIINAPITLLVVISTVAACVRRKSSVFLALATFGPVAIASWLYLDVLSASRFSIGYAPLIAFLAADGLEVVTAGRRTAQYVATAAMVMVMMAWAAPALYRTHTQPAPTVTATNWIRDHVPTRSSTIYVDRKMIPFAQEELPQYRLRIADIAPSVTWTERQFVGLLAEGASKAPRAVNFVWPKGRLWHLVRRRYFAVSIRPVVDVIAFGEGWYRQENTGAVVWRWMGKRSMTELPPVAGEAELTLLLYVPLDALSEPPTIDVRLNGNPIDRFRATAKNIARTYNVKVRENATNELVLETDRTVNPAARHLGGDVRDLGIRLNGLGWVKAP
jgi:hypothetical protein